MAGRMRLRPHAWGQLSTLTLFRGFRTRFPNIPTTAHPTPIKSVWTGGGAASGKVSSSGRILSPPSISSYAFTTGSTFPPKKTPESNPDGKIAGPRVGEANPADAGFIEFGTLSGDVLTEILK